MATTKEITVNGVVTSVTEFDHSAQEIDDATARALAGGAIDQLLAGKAPAGYGLGETVSDSVRIASAAALDATVEGGIYYYYNSDEQATGYPYSQFGMVVVIATEAVMRQYFFPRRTDTRWWVRQKTNYSDTWGPWEWGKAPMELGVEYRTTERYNGKPVYKKAVSIGSITGDGTLTFALSGATTVLSGELLFRGYLPFNYINGRDLSNAWTRYANVTRTGSNIEVSYYIGSSCGTSDGTIVILRYLKD